MTAYQFKIQPQPTTTVWTATAANLLAGEVYYLFNRDASGAVCNITDYHVLLPLVDGNLPNPTTLGQSPGEPENTVDVCRDDYKDGSSWSWVLTGTLNSGGQSGGKNKNN